MELREETSQRYWDELGRENEARVQLKLDGAYVGLFEWNIVTNKSQWSTGFYRLHGLVEDEPPSYELWRQQVHPDDLSRVEAEIQRAVAEVTKVDTDYRIMHPNGELRWTYLKAVVKSDERGVPTAMTGYCGDITRRKLADAALLETQKLAIAGRMSAAIAHEINNPLEAAYNLVYLARGMASDGDQADLLDQTIEQLKRVSEIAQQTLRFSRPAKPRMVKIPDVVGSTLHLLGPKLALASMKVETEFRENAEILCSPGELQQILTNILNNAAEASRELRRAKIRVQNSVDWKDQRTAGVRVTISDAGPGMPPETVRRLREPFFTTKEGTGTGLGMWVVHELMAKLRGTISVRSSISERGRGTTISLFFPLHTQAE